MASESDLVPDADPDATSAMEPIDAAAEAEPTTAAEATDSASPKGAGGRLSSFLRSDPVLLESTTASGVPGLGPVPGLGATETVTPTLSRHDQDRKDQAREDRARESGAKNKRTAPVVADPVADQPAQPGADEEFVVPQNPQMEPSGGVAEVVVTPGTPRPTMRDRRAAGKLRARKVRRLIRHFEPWSVLKISLLFFFCLWAIFMLAGYGLWYFANEAEVLDNVENFIEQLFVLEEFSFNWDQIFRACALGGLVLVVAATGFMVLMAVLFNLISDLTGGVRVTVIEEETARVWPSRRAHRQAESG
ncbi:MAG: DUF3566 domain-containing protein [Acidimicrobiales bacterium]|nr:DUF3566 domain-containing protein [Acidimicrobiales bacterium]